MIYGGRRAGKSYDVSQLFQFIVINYPNVGIYCIRKIGATLRHSVFKRHHDGFSKHNLLGGTVIENKTDLSFTVKHNGSFIACKGLDDPEKMKSTEGVTIVHWEEGTEVSKNDFEVVDGGLSPAEYPAIHIITHNPVPNVPGELHWLQEKFLHIPHEMGKLAIQDDFAILKVNYTHNFYCPEANKRQLEKYKKENPALYRMWVLGEFTDFEGIIFPAFELVEDVPDYLDFLGYGLDFGFSKDPAALIGVWANSEYICIKGFIYETGLTNPMLVDRMKEVGVNLYDSIVADSAEPKTIKEISKDFQYIEGAKKYPFYQADVIRVIYGYKLLIVSGDINLQKERATFCWQKQRKSEKFINKPEDKNNHYMDAFIMRCLKSLDIPTAEELTVEFG